MFQFISIAQKSVSSISVFTPASFEMEPKGFFDGFSNDIGGT